MMVNGTNDGFWFEKKGLIFWGRIMLGERQHENIWQCNTKAKAIQLFVEHIRYWAEWNKRNMNRSVVMNLVADDVEGTINGLPAEQFLKENE
jgi:ribosomal protein L17